MCFGKTWTSISASACLLSAIFIKDIRLKTVSLFLAIKELIQLGLLFENSCTIVNKYLTQLSWIHISFQPFFVNLLIQTFSTKDYNVPLALSLIFAIANILKLKDIYSYSEDKCNNGIMCKEKTCSYDGKYHVAYGFNLNTSDYYTVVPSWFSYFLLMFAPALILGDYLIISIHMLILLISNLISNDPGEVAAMWCLNSFWIALFPFLY